MYTERKAIFDVYCENEQGEKFIVEMQNAYQTYFGSPDKPGGLSI